MMSRDCRRAARKLRALVWRVETTAEAVTPRQVAARTRAINRLAQEARRLYERNASNRSKAMDEQKERAAFEAFQSRQGWAKSDLADKVAEGAPAAGEYRHGGLQADWEIWQARAALASMPAPADPAAWMVYNGVCPVAVHLSSAAATADRDRRQMTHDLSGCLSAHRVVPLYAERPQAQGGKL